MASSAHSQHKPWWLKLIITLLCLAILSAIRLPFEHSIYQELQAKKLIAKPLDAESRSALQQKSFYAAFGSIRPTIAAFKSIAVSNLHRKQDWPAIRKEFGEIATLDPYNFFYWDYGSWHISTNAAASYLEDPNLSPPQRLAKSQKFFQYGVDFAKRGIKENPEAWRQYELVGNLLSNPYRFPNYAEAEAYYAQAQRFSPMADLQREQLQRDELYAIMHQPERYQDTYDLSRKLFFASPSHHVPTVLNLIWVYQHHPLVNAQQKLNLKQIYGTPENAYHCLGILWQNAKDKPTYGVEPALRRLERFLAIPQKDRLIKS